MSSESRKDIVRRIAKPSKAGSPAPLLEVSGAGMLDEAARSFLLVKPVALLGTAFSVVVVAAASAWTFKYAPALLVLVFCGSIVLATAVALAARHFGLSRTARVLFYEDRILVLRPGEDCDRGTTIAWTDLAGYGDGSADYVRLRTTGALGGLRSLRLSVPTPTEEERVAVLALLDRRGVPRLA